MIETQSIDQLSQTIDNYGAATTMLAVFMLIVILLIVFLMRLILRRDKESKMLTREVITLVKENTPTNSLSLDKAVDEIRITYQRSMHIIKQEIYRVYAENGIDNVGNQEKIKTNFKTFVCNQYNEDVTHLDKLYYQSKSLNKHMKKHIEPLDIAIAIPLMILNVKNYQRADVLRYLEQSFVGYINSTKKYLNDD